MFGEDWNKYFQEKYGAENVTWETDIQSTNILFGNKNGRNYKLDKSKRTGNVTYKKASGSYGEYSTKIESKVIEIEKANLPDGLKKTFTDNYYRIVESVDELKAHRIFGGNADAGGGFATTEPAFRE